LIFFFVDSSSSPKEEVDGCIRQSFLQRDVEILGRPILSGTFSIHEKNCIPTRALKRED
jgi:hypothetical protein